MIKIIHWVCRNKMIVTMGYFISYKHGTNSITPCRFLNCGRKFFCHLKYCRIIWFWHICKVINFTLGNNECMSKFLWKNIKKSIYIFIFIYFIRRNLSWDDARKKSRHMWCYNQRLCNAWMTHWGTGWVLKKILSFSFKSLTESPNSNGLE